jgi:hypothetical protein
MLIYCINFKEKKSEYQRSSKAPFFFNSMDANEHDKDRIDF